MPKAERLGRTYGILNQIEGWCRAARGEVERMVMAGMTVIGTDDKPMKIVQGKKGNRAWSDEKMAEALLAGILPPEKYLKPRKIITPSAAADLLDKAKTRAQWEPFKEIIKQADGGPKVTLGSDPRPAYVPAAGAAEFEVIADSASVVQK